MMPFIHGMISVPAGVVRMNVFKFYFYTAIGSLLWIAPTVLLGYVLGSQWKTVLSILDAYEYLWYALIGLAIGYYLHSQRQHKGETMASD
jgi:membrane protein DedA with SNARE-associated domain